MADFQTAPDALDAAVEAAVDHGPDIWAMMSWYDRTHAAKRMEMSRTKLSLADASLHHRQ